MSRFNRDIIIFIIQVTLISITLPLNLANLDSLEIPKPTNIQFEEDALVLDSLTLKQKIAQMVITYEDANNKEILQNMLIGGIHFGAKESKQEFIETIADFQEGANVPFFMTADLEGCWNLFAKFQEFPTFREIESVEQAYQVGYNEGKLLKELGFSMNFAPVLDLEDNIWGCRNFNGEVAEKAQAYVKGMQDNGIIATAKHYPGKTLQAEDPHEKLNLAVITGEDLAPFQQTMDNEVEAVMVSHIIVEGVLDSQNKPSTVSTEVVSDLRGRFDGLIVSDEIRMKGLRDYYPEINQMYVDLFKADNDIILYFERDPRTLYNLIEVVAYAVDEGIIKEERIDNSVRRILKAKGIAVIK